MMKNTNKRKTNDPNVYPRGWTRKQIDALRRHYENQTEDEAAAELEAAFRKQTPAPAKRPRRRGRPVGYERSVANAEPILVPAARLPAGRLPASPKARQLRQPLAD